VGDPEARERRDERALLDGHTAERERPDIPAAAELLGGIVPSFFIGEPGDGGIEPREGPHIGLPGKGDHVRPVREHVLHPVERGDGVVCDQDEWAAVPDLPEFRGPVIHEIDMEDVGAGLPEQLGEDPVIARHAGPDLDRDRGALLLEGPHDGGEPVGVLQERLPASGLDHSRLAAVGIDLVHDRGAQCPDHGPEGFGRGSPEAETGDYGRGSQFFDLGLQFRNGIVADELLTVPGCGNLPGSFDGREIDGIPAHEREADMVRPFEHVRGIHDAGHGCDRYGGFNDTVVDNQAEAIECIHHKFIYVHDAQSNYFRVVPVRAHDVSHANQVSMGLIEEWHGPGLENAEGSSDLKVGSRLPSACRGLRPLHPEAGESNKSSDL